MLPCLLLVALAFCRSAELRGEVIWTFTMENFGRLCGAGSYFWIILRSLWIAAVTTVLSIALSYPLAFFIATRRERTRYLLLGLVMVPFCTNLVIRLSAWTILFSNQFFLAKWAAALGLIDQDMPLYPSSLAVYVGMVSSFLPFAVLPIYTNVERMDWSIVEAAQDLYAGRWRMFRHAILPQTVPGLTAAILLTFIPAMGTFIVSNILGGAKYMLVGNLIEQQFLGVGDLPFGAAISFVLIVLTIVAVVILRRYERPVEAAA
jgi:spermidine/putrescine transport system permease protein